jgi:hypothetical protein
MMAVNREQFFDLAWQSWESPDRADLQAAVASILQAHPEWRDEYLALKTEFARLQEAIPAAATLESFSSEESIPPARLEALMAQLPHARARPQTSAFPWMKIAAAAALIATGAWFVIPKAERTFDPTPWLAQASPSLMSALQAPLSSVLAQANLPTLRDDATIHLQSPLIATATGEITIAWRGASPAYLAIHSAGKQIWSAHDQSSPARGPTLPPNQTFELVITPQENNATAREYFVTTERAAPTSESFAAIMQAITTEPQRLGDAVLAWHALSPSEQQSELGVRLGLWLGVSAQQPDILAKARADAHALTAER